MNTRSISVRLDEDLLPQIDALAARNDRSRNWWINAAIRSALAEEAAWVARIEDGIREADAGLTTPHEDVMARVRAKVG